MKTMKAVVFKGKDRIAVEEVPKPRPQAGEAVIRVTTTTICGTDVHIVRGEYPVKPGLILGHEPVGVVEELGPGLEDLYDWRAGDRRGHHTVRAMFLLPERMSLAVRRRNGRLEVRQHHQRRLGGVPARAGCESQPRAHTARPRRRGRRAVPRHLFDGPRRRRKRRRQGRRQRGRFCRGLSGSVRRSGQS